MAFEIATFLFSEVLRCPWCIAHMTGNVMEDMVMMFLLPTIIIILFVYVLVSDLKIVRNNWMKLLMGVAFYLFIIFGGFFEIVAQITKTYFIILIFVLGILYFVLGHFLKGDDSRISSKFRRDFSGGGNYSGTPTSDSSTQSKQVKQDYRRQMKLARNQKDLLNKRIHDLDSQIGKLHPSDINRGHLAMQLNNLKTERDKLDWDIKHRMKYRGESV